MSKGYKRGGARINPGKRIVVYVEGKATEKEYLTDLRRRLGLSPRLIDIRPSKYTDLASILAQAAKEKNRMANRVQRGEPGVDQWWVLADTEGEASFSEELAFAQKNGIHIAINDPSVELWLRLHFGYTTRPYASAHEVIRDLSQFLPGYSESNKHPDMSVLAPLVPAAIDNAGRLRETHTKVVGGPPQTDCDLLVIEMNNQARDERTLFQKREICFEDLALYQIGRRAFE